MAVIYLCPADKRVLCSWEGPASDIKQHFESEHHELLYHTNSVKIDLEKLPENKLLCLKEDLYLMQTFVQTRELVIRLRYLGSMEAASKIQYEITVTAGTRTYKYDPLKYSCVIPRADGWEINLESIQRKHGKIDSLICNLIVTIEEEINLERKMSIASITSFEEKIVKDIDFVNQRIEKLKRQQSENKEQKESPDYMDRISQFNFSILEHPFGETFKKFKNENEEASLTDIPKEVNLKCTSCNLALLPPIYLCVKGHNVCNRCQTEPCKVCNSVVTDKKNSDLEEISRKSVHHCRYNSEGCLEKLRYNELRAHEVKCNYCKYKCMSSNCPYQGKFDHFSNHVKVVHTSVKVTTSMRTEIPKGTELYIVNKSIGVFYCTSEMKDDFMIWRATFCGASERQFSCEIYFSRSKYKDPIFLKRKENVWEVRKSLSDLKKNKAKAKYAVLNIVSFDS